MNRIIKITAFIMAGALIATSSCHKDGSEEPLRVAVASNVKFAIEDIAKAFTEESGIPVDVSTGSSGKLTAQIESGAPFHVFLSANMKYPERLISSKFAVGEIAVYALGSLAVCTSSESIEIESWKDLLSDRSVEKVGIANPENAPYGVQSIKIFESLGLYDDIKSKIVTGENIAQALQFSISGGAELAFTAKSLTLAPDVKGSIRCVDVEKNLYSPIKQGVVILALGKSEQKESAEAFYAFLKTEKARKIFDTYGYALPSKR